MVKCQPKLFMYNISLLSDSLAKAQLVLNSIMILPKRWRHPVIPEPLKAKRFFLYQVECQLMILPEPNTQSDK